MIETIYPLILKFETLSDLKFCIAVRNFKCYNKYKIIDKHAFVN